MSRKNRFNQQNSSYTQRGRDSKIIANLRRLPLSKYIYKPIDRVRDNLRELEDRRTYQPGNIVRKAAAFPLRAAARLVPKSVTKTIKGTTYIGSQFKDLWDGDVPSGIKFLNPKNVVMCARRSMRRQVLHAFKIAGKRGLGSPRYNEFSKISCRG